MENQLFKELTASQVNGSDSADVELFTFKSRPGIARVPIGVSFYKPAGTAYTVAAGARVEIFDEDGEVWFSTDATALLATASASGRFQRPTNVAFTANPTTVSFRVTGAVSAGDSTLGLRVYYKDYPIAW